MATLPQDILQRGYEAEAELAGRIRRRNMRQAGLTFLNIRRCVRELVEEGDLVADMSPEVMRDIILNRLYSDNAAAFAAFSALDWAAILAFFVKILPLLIQLIGLL